MELTRQQVKQVWKAFLAAFDYAELEQLVYFQLERDLDEIASSHTDSSTVCFKLVRQAAKDGWLEDLIRAAVDNKPKNEKLKQLARDLHLEFGGTNSTAESIVLENAGPDTGDPLLIVGDFMNDLKEIPAEQSWNSEDYEHELESLQSRLPRLRTQVRSLVPQRGNDLEKSVLRELRFENAIEDALTVINAFEICVNCLLDSSRPQGILAQTRYVQWFRRKSRNVSDCLSLLQRLGDNPKTSRKEDTSSKLIDFSLFAFIQHLRGLHVSDANRLDERRQLLTTYSGIDACLNAVIEYLKGAAVPGENNIKLVRELLVNVGGFIEHTALAQKRLPSMPGSIPLFPPGEGTRLQKICDEALDGLDLYYRINHELISSWEEAALNGVAIRADARDLYRARRSLIGKLITLRRRIAALTY